MIKSNIKSYETEEINKFESLAKDWWNINGPFRTLHQINPARLQYINEQIKTHYNITDIRNLKILDIGCGGGIVSAPLAKLGAKVTGIDAGKANIEAAKIYAAQNDLDAEFLAIDIEAMKGKFDVILCLEVIEHIINIEEFIRQIRRLMKPNAIVIFSTINRNIQSFVKAIAIAEYIAGFIPKGTHEWNKFIKPSELAKMMNENNMDIANLKGMSYNIFNKRWYLSDDISVNYFMSGIAK